MRRPEADLLLCAVTGCVFEPVGLMKRDLGVYAQLGVELMTSPTLCVRVYFVFTRRRCVVFTFVSEVRFALPTHTVDPPTTSSSSSTTLSHAPPFALADSPPPIASTALQSLTPKAGSPPTSQITPTSSSLPPLHGVVHGELTPALRAPQFTTRRNFGAAGPLGSEEPK